MWLIVPIKWPSVAIRFHNGFFTNTISCERRSSIAKLRAKLAKKRRAFEELGSRVVDRDRALSEMRGPAIGESTLAVSPSIQFMPKV
jgi:hypothetical protein